MLEPNKLYKIVQTVPIRPVKSYFAQNTAMLEKGSIILFLQYHPGNVYSCKVLSGEYIGWITIESRYKNHMDFFQKIKGQ